MADGHRPTMLVLTQYYPPEPGAASIRLQAMAQQLAARGWTVNVVTAFPHHLGHHNPQYAGRVFARETDGPVSVLRTWIWAVRVGRLRRRLLNYFSFVATGFLGLWRQGRADYILVESPPLFLGLSAYVYSRLRRIPYILSVSDLWPESAVALGLVTNPTVIGATRRLEMFLYHHAYRVSAVTEGIRDTIRETAALPPDRLLFAPNGVDVGGFAEAAADPALVSELGLEGQRVFLYPGTLGYAQGLGIILDAADLLRARTDITFLLVGDGPVRAALVEEARRRGLDRVRFVGLQPQARMPAYYALARAVVVPLKNHRLFRGARPSKAFPAWAAARPVIFCGEGEMARVVAASGAGVTVPPEDGAALAAAVARYADMPTDAWERLGQSGRHFVEQHYTWERIMQRWTEGLAPS